MITWQLFTSLVLHKKSKDYFHLVFTAWSLVTGGVEKWLATTTKLKMIWSSLSDTEICNKITRYSDRQTTIKFQSP